MTLIRYGLLLLLCFTTAMSYRVTGQDQEQDAERSVRSKRASGATQNVIIKKLSVLVEGREEAFIDLTQPEEDIKRMTIPVKGGSKYQIKVYFLVPSEIVFLFYGQTFTLKGIQVHKMKEMVGAFVPRPELQSYTMPVEEAPTARLQLGLYKVKSRIMDEDMNTIFSWEWNLYFN